MRKIVLVTIVAGLALLATSVGLALTKAVPSSQPHEDMEPVQLASRTAPSQFRGTATSPEAILRGVLEDIGRTELTDVKIGAPPPGTSAVERETPGSVPLAPPSGLFLYATVPPAGENGDAVRAIWAANLIGGSLSDHLRSRGSAPLASVQIFQPDQTGNVENIGGGLGNVVAGQQFLTDGPEDMGPRIRSGAKAAGLEVRSMEFLKPAQFAPALVVAAADADAIIARSASPEFLQGIFGDVANLEGFYLEIRDKADVPILKLASANRAGAGQTWMHPRYRHPTGDLGSSPPAP